MVRCMGSGDARGPCLHQEAQQDTARALGHNGISMRAYGTAPAGLWPGRGKTGAVCVGMWLRAAMQHATLGAHANTQCSQMQTDSSERDMPVGHARTCMQLCTR